MGGGEGGREWESYLGGNFSNGPLITQRRAFLPSRGGRQTVVTDIRYGEGREKGEAC